jgi:hypothetical protein
MSIALEPGIASAPDWLICGQPSRDGVRIIASRRLSYAELRAEYRHASLYVDHLLEPVGSVLTSADISLTAHMMPRGAGDLVMIEGPNYRDVLAQLEIACAYCGSCIIGTACRTCGSPRQSLIDKANDRRGR